MFASQNLATRPTLGSVRTIRCGTNRRCGVIGRRSAPLKVLASAAAGAAAAGSSLPSSASSPPQNLTSVLTPGANYQAVVGAGVAKGGFTASKTLLLGVLAGAFIAFGCFMTTSIGCTLTGLAASNPGVQKLLMGLVFPVGLMMSIQAGGELFTSNTMFTSAAVYEGKLSLPLMLRNWALSYAGNFIGSIAFAAAVFASGLLASSAMPAAMAVTKTSMDFGTLFVRAVLCNWLVCKALWMASSSSSLPGKTLAIWVPLTTFVAIGLEHSVANMFYISLGMMQGAPVTAQQFLLGNLLPVTLGNIFAGVVCVSLMYALSYGALSERK